MAVTTEADLCNQALANVGHTQLITGLTDTSVAGQLCNLLYGQCRDRILEEYDWPFARWHAVLALLSGVTRSGWQYCYSLPANSLVPRYIFGGLRPGAPVSSVAPVANPWVVMWSGTPYAGFAPRVPFGLELSDDGATPIIVTDQSAAELIYTAQLTNVLVFTPIFKEALIMRLTAKLFMSLAKDRARHDTWLHLAEQETKKAFAAVLREAQEDPPRDAEAISIRG